MNNSNLKLSIIIPGKNEEPALIEKSFRKLAEYLKSQNFGKVEILYVTPDGDKSGKMAEKMKSTLSNLRIIYSQNLSGKGAAVRLGMFEAKGKYRLFMDADLATPLHHIKEAYELMEEGAQVAIAVRDLFRIHKGLLRKVITKTANIVVQILLVPGIKDTQCGFKIFSEDAAIKIFSRQSLLRWSFDVEILKIARALGYKIRYIEAPDWKDPKKVGLIGENPLKIAIAEFKDPFIVLLKFLTGKYRKPSYVHQRELEVAKEV